MCEENRDNHLLIVFVLVALWFSASFSTALNGTSNCLQGSFPESFQHFHVLCCVDFC